MSFLAYYNLQTVDGMRDSPARNLLICFQNAFKKRDSNLEELILKYGMRGHYRHRGVQVTSSGSLH